MAARVLIVRKRIIQEDDTNASGSKGDWRQGLEMDSHLSGARA